ncbi:ATP-dependent endonuclease [Methanobacterium sp. SMA-27]|uniref:ATP-dependent nuclease n=1 Tax=Methanobacterium sp. SMA-27 TaxID=1495336 RepID=UPI00064E738D|nr:AAA family ATPase [Methanobacterium sp. SMA-27]
MYLEKLIIKNFRAIERLELDFDKGLNILIGENNSGKTAVIDALRLCLGDFKQPRDIYCSQSDFRIDKSKIDKKIQNIEFDLIFKCENEIETAWFNSLHVLDANGNHSLQLHFKFELLDFKSDKRVKRSVWGGKYEGGKVPFEVRSALRNIYLGALRDANNKLRPTQSNILGNLYSNIIINEDKEENQKEKEKLLQLITDTLDEEEWSRFIKKGNESILEHLNYLSYLTPDKKQDVKISFAPLEFGKFVQKLIMQLPVYSDESIDENHKQQFFEIWQNGLGLNNLIYTATVLGDIKQKNKVYREEYNLLLIEEPEAHLHPQLQNTFFNYLKELDENEFQIIVTSHSPTIAAKTDLNLLTILQNDHNNISSTQIKDLKLEDKSLKYLQKFLDVTKSQLFFANGVILVEGISEAILIPIFSKILAKKISEKYDIERNGIEVVNINGVAFEHFAKLFNSQDGNRLKCRCALVTDDDKGKAHAEARIEKIMALESDNLKPLLGEITFEYDLFKSNKDSKKVILDVFHEIHRNLHSQLIQIEDLNEQAKFFAEKLESNDTKSEFAYLLAIELEKGKNLQNFKVPDYIKKSIQFVIDD